MSLLFFPQGEIGDAGGDGTDGKAGVNVSLSVIWFNGFAIFLEVAQFFLPVCLLVCLSACLSVCLSVCLLSVCQLSVCLVGYWPCN